MAGKNYQKSLWLIVITAVMLIAVQGYYVYQNYQTNKARFILDMQQALDASIENYYASRAVKNIYVLSNQSVDTLIQGKKPFAYSSITQNLDSIASAFLKRDSMSSSSFTQVWTEGDSVSVTMDSLLKDKGSYDYKFHISSRKDSLGETEVKLTERVQEFEFLTQKVMLSISEDLLDLGKVYTELQKELESLDIDVAFKLTQNTGDRKTSIGTLNTKNILSAEAQSKYILEEDSIRVDFENATLKILRSGLTELTISFLLVALVVGTLLHLYRTIFRQKQLAAIKDDLISNITHEFKTPIATIFSALEGVTSFNEKNDPEKTKRYISLSNEQLHKLNHMVEKMLETATIDQGRLSLDKEDIEVVSWTKGLVEQFQLVHKEKKIRFDTTLSSFVRAIDPFHVENALSNLLDNAIKYGGDTIEVSLSAKGETVEWRVQDNGGKIPKSQQEKIFDKLYRIPTGNTHDVKGFGIGLYYARTIAQMHSGSLTLQAGEGKTTFTLSI